VKSAVIKRSIVIAGHKTSVSLEDGFWNGLRDIATSRGLHLSELVNLIDKGRQNGNLSSAIRLFVLNHYRALSGQKDEQTSPSIASENDYEGRREERSEALSALRAE
jgi:predicted DNA-binding ribbon-helix-helix protein